MTKDEEIAVLKERLASEKLARRNAEAMTKEVRADLARVTACLQAEREYWRPFEAGTEKPAK